MIPGLMRVITTVRALVGGVGVVALTVAVFPFAVVSSTFRWVEMQDAICRVWGGGILSLFGVRVKLTGEENFPPKSACLLLFNHQSLFDIPVIYGTLKRRVRFGAKAELFRIPIFGLGMRVMGTLPVTRKDRASTLQTYKDAESKIAEGFSYALAPEGTRQEKPVIGSFKAGPFIFAIGAQAPIVLAVIRGAHDVLPKKRLLPNLDRWTRTVHLHLTPAIPTRGLVLGETGGDLGPLIDRARAAMVEAYDRLPSGSGV